MKRCGGSVRYGPKLLNITVLACTYSPISQNSRARRAMAWPGCLIIVITVTALENYNSRCQSSRMFIQHRLFGFLTGSQQCLKLCPGLQSNIKRLPYKLEHFPSVSTVYRCNNALCSYCTWSHLYLFLFLLQGVSGGTSIVCVTRLKHYSLPRPESRVAERECRVAFECMVVEVK